MTKKAIAALVAAANLSPEFGAGAGSGAGNARRGRRYSAQAG